MAVERNGETNKTSGDDRFLGITPVPGEKGLVKVIYIINGRQVTVRKSTGLEPRRRDVKNPEGEQV
jgi:hypothetical protein